MKKPRARSPSSGEENPSRVEGEGPSRVEVEGPSRVEVEGPSRVEVEGPSRVEVEGPSRVEVEGPSWVEVEDPSRVEVEGPSRVEVSVHGLPAWLDAKRLLGEGSWHQEAGTFHASLSRSAAADLQARLRGIGIGGHELTVQVHPPLHRSIVRAARTNDARRRRDTSVGFTLSGTRLDAEGRISLTPEKLADAIAQGTAGLQVVDACAGAGGNAIAFARAGAKVTAVELVPERLGLARHNARLYGVEHDIKWIVGDCLELLADLKGDLLFIDPPWGEEWDRRKTSLSALPLLASLLTSPHRLRFAKIIAKVPPSFVVSAVPTAAAHAVFGEGQGDYRRVKFLLLEITKPSR